MKTTIVKSLLAAAAFLGTAYLANAQSTSLGAGNTNFGNFSLASGGFNTIFGGFGNHALGWSATIGTGSFNLLTGLQNTTAGSFNFVTGLANTPGGSFNLVGGQNNAGAGNQNLVFGSFLSTGALNGSVILSDNNPFSIRTTAARFTNATADSMTGIFNGGYAWRTNSGQVGTGIGANAGVFITPSAANTAANGNPVFVGINKPAPTQTLDVVGNTLTSGSFFSGDPNTVIARSGTGTKGNATGVSFGSSVNEPGVLIEHFDGESGGFFANGQTAAIWSPADNGRIISFYDEDTLPAAGNVAGPTARSFIDSSGALVTVAGGTSTYGSSAQVNGALSVGSSAQVSGSLSVGTTQIASKATLEVATASGTSPAYSPIGFLSTAGASVVSISSGAASIWASGFIFGSSFIAFSDERMKVIKGHSDGAQDLATLLKIRITDFRYIDTATKGTGEQKKVIAQQVEAVYPQAVSRATDVVPDIYQKTTIQGGWVKLATNLKVGERVRLIGEKEEGIHEVIEVREDAFRTAFQPATDKVFVYGREVKDFRTVDYEAIAMLNVSATQELARKVEAKDAEIAALKKQLAALEARDKAREARLARLEAAGSARPARAVPAVLGLKASAQ